MTEVSREVTGYLPTDMGSLPNKFYIIRTWRMVTGVYTYENLIALHT